ETFKCPATGTEVKLYDQVPRHRHDLLKSLYGTYFGGGRLADDLMREFRRLKELSPSEGDAVLIRRVFATDPFNRIPKEEIDAIVTRFQNPPEVFFFLQRNFRSYRNFLRRAPGKG